MRLINAVREWNAQGLPPLRTIAIHTAVDRTAMFVREADEAVLLGPDDPEHLGPSPYLDYAELRRALTIARADAVWPGWGFVSEKAEFARLCRDMDIVFIGPSPEVIEQLGDKIASKLLAEEVGVPMAAWSKGPVADLADAREHAERIGYPLMIKATAGGGGRGIRKVERPEDLAEAFERASSEGAKTAGDGTVFMERAISGGRHVEVQVVADATGDVWTLGVRECSVQRRNQKVLEESASIALDDEQDQLLRTSAAALAKAAGYVNAGTVEFLYEPRERLLSFLEVNTRLQVEHCVTEATTGVDIVKLQLHVAGGGKLAEIAPEPPTARGHAIEARLTAEDPEQGFAPAPGNIEYLSLPAGPGVRVDTGVATGDTIPPQFDSMIAKIIAWGRDRDEARARLSRALRQTAVVIDGGTTNKAFLLDLLDRPEMLAGEVDTTWLDTLMADGYAPPRRTDVALLAAAIEAQDAHVARQRARLFASAERGRPEVGHDTVHQVNVRAGGESYRMRVAQSRGTRYHVELDGKGVDVEAEHTGRFERKLAVGDTTFAVLSAPQGNDYLVEVDGTVHRISGGEAGMVRAPAPAMVVAIPVSPGDEVTAGDVVAVVESMKLETALRAPVSGRVREILVAPNTQVEGGTKLVRLEPDSDGEAVVGTERASLAGLATPPVAGSDPAAVAADALTSLRYLVLGYDIDERDARPLLAALNAARQDLPPDDPTVLEGELATFQIFADLCTLSRNRRGPEDESQQIDPAGEEARNPQEYLYAYLRSRDADAEGLPESFRAKLRRALAHYGVADLEQSDQLSSALYRMFVAHRRATAQVPVLLDLLSWRLRRPDSLPAYVRERYQRVLDHLVSATQLRHPLVGGLARRVRYTCFDAPVIAAERAKGQQAVRELLDHLADDPVERAAQIDRMVAAADPILGVFGSDAPRGDARGDDAPLLPGAGAHRRPGRGPGWTAAAHGVVHVPRKAADRARHHRAHRAERARGHRPDVGAGRPAAADRPAGRRRELASGASARRELASGASARQHRAAGSLRHRGRGTRHRPGALRGEDPRDAREAPRTPGAGRGGGAPSCGRRALGLVHVPTRSVGSAAGRGPHPAWSAPDGGRAAGPVAAARTSTSPGCPRRSTCTCSAPSARTCPTTSGSSSSPTSATSRSCATRRATSARCRSWSTCSTPAWTRCAPPARPTGATRGPTGTACCSTCGRSRTSVSTSWGRSCGSSPPGRRPSGWSRCSSSSGTRPRRRTSPPSTCCGCRGRRVRASPCGSPRRPPRPCASWTPTPRR